MPPLYSPQDARRGAPRLLDLETYDASAMMADLGDQRLKNLPLRGRVVYQTETQATSKNGVQNEAISKWKDYHEKEAEELGRSHTEGIEPDGLGLGGSYRNGPNYRPAQNIRSNPFRFRMVHNPPNRGRSVSSTTIPPGGLLGPRPTNPSARVIRNQLVTRHLNLKPLAGFGGGSNVASRTVFHPTQQPVTNVATSKWTTGKLVPSSAHIPQSLLNFNGITPKSNQAQLAINTAPLTTMVTPTPMSSGIGSYPLQVKPVDMQNTLASTATSRSASRSSSAVRSETTTSSAVAPPRAPFRNAALPIKPPSVRDTIRTVPEASKNHWNKITLHPEASNALVNTTLPKSASIPKSGVEERCTTAPPNQENKEMPTIHIGTEVHNSTQPKYGGLTASKYASATSNNQFSSGRNHLPSTTQQPLGLPSNKALGPTPSGLSASKYATPAQSGLSASKYASPVSPGLSTSKYAPPVSASLSASKYANPVPPGPSPRPCPKRSSVPTALSSTKATTNPLNSMSSSGHSTAQTTSAEGVAVAAEVMMEVKDVKDPNQIVHDKGIVDKLEQEPLQPSQRLVDSIAARYKFATPKQVAGLARRYGTVFLPGCPSSIYLLDRELEDVTRVFRPLFIPGRRR